MPLHFQSKHEMLPAGAFIAQQVHGTRAIRVCATDCVEALALQQADALWTTNPGLIVAVKTADCVPVLLEGPSCVAAIHAGWRGIVAGIVPKTIQTILSETGLKPADLKAELGPCIGGDIYQIGLDVSKQVPAEFLWLDQHGNTHFDMRAFIALQLKDAGLEQVHLSTHCTYSEPDNYYSARRGDAERQYSLAWL